MLVRLTTDRAGDYSFHRAGETLDLPDREALALIRRGSAERVQPEAATVAPVESAMRPAAARHQRQIRRG